MPDLIAQPREALALLHERHLDHHGPGRICAGPETCPAVFYLGVVEQLIEALERSDAGRVEYKRQAEMYSRDWAEACREREELRAQLSALEPPAP